MKTAADYRASAQESRQRSRDSFERCDTDGFLSQWANDIGASLDDEKATILENGGLASFVGLYDADGNRVPAKLVTSTFNYNTVFSWKLSPDAAAKYGRRFVPCNWQKPGRIQKALGLHQQQEMAPAWAEISGSGRGLSGCANAFVRVYRTGDEWGMDATRIDS